MPTTVFQLEISLDHLEPKIWRQVLVPSDITLARLHHVIQVVMGWDDDHLHEFRVGKRRYSNLEQRDDGNVEDEQATVLAEFVTQGKKLSYLYDLGDSWQHTLLVENREPVAGQKLPLCIGGERACPPEDIGGPGGYENFLDALGNPKHRDHAYMRDRVAEDFDPAVFDIDAVNKALKKLKLK